jgi:hypothetical protein
MGIMETRPNPTTIPAVIKKVVFVSFGLLLLYFGIQLIRYHFLLVTFPYPLEYREGAILFVTDLLLEGENPYALQNMPLAMNVYGINYHLIVYPFARLWGATFLVHRAVSAVFILLSLPIFFVILRRHRAGVLYSLAAVLILYASLLYRYTPLARPDGVGFFYSSLASMSRICGNTPPRPWLPALLLALRRFIPSHISSCPFPIWLFICFCSYPSKKPFFMDACRFSCCCLRHWQSMGIMRPIF